MRRACAILASIAAFAPLSLPFAERAPAAAHEVIDVPDACGDAAMADFNMRITFSLLSGACVPEVHLLVRDEAGAVVIDLVSHGAPVYASVPPGTYVLTARYRDQQSMQRFTIDTVERSLAHFSWPVSAEANSHAARPHPDPLDAH